MRTIAAAMLGLCLASCAHVGIVQTHVATGETKPKSIYIRPFEIAGAEFTGSQPGDPGELPIRKSLAPKEFARALKVEMAKMAPAMVINDDERPVEGWVIEGSFELIDGGSRAARFFFPFTPAGASKVIAHVKVTNVETNEVVYMFDIGGGSGWTAKFGDLSAAGVGQATQFDFKNAAEEIYIALSTDPYRYGNRTRPLRYY